MQIFVTSRQKKFSINPLKIKSLVKKILKHERETPDEVSIVFADRKIIQFINRRFLKKSGLTDVISFDNSLKFPKKNISWEIIICTDVAAENANKFNTSREFEWKLYLIHGLLHLMGYDDLKEKQRKLMRRKERDILKFLKLI